MNKANQDIRDYMADHGVSQKDIASEVGISQYAVYKKLQTEMPQQEKVMYLNMIDSIEKQKFAKEVFEDVLSENPADPVEETGTKFQIGDRVKIPAKQETCGVVSDIWSSVAQSRTMYEVTLEDNGDKALYAEEQLEPAPIPTSYSFEAHISGNVAVFTMNATQGDNTWVYARGHAHILHDGEVGIAQAVSFAARRMFESLDKKQESKIYVRGVTEK